MFGNMFRAYGTRVSVCVSTRWTKKMPRAYGSMVLGWR